MHISARDAVVLALAMLLAVAHAQPGTSFPVSSLPTFGAPRQNQFTGYLSANETNGAQYFYWLVESDYSPSTAPLIIWLQGGPGCSSMIGLFNELGPFYVSPNAELYSNQNGWNRLGNVLFIDQPAGTGFSYAAADAQFAVDEYEMANDLFFALQNFIKVFPQYANRPTFIAGESYAGKYIPAIGTKFLQQGSNVPLKLVGLAIGDGWTSPLEQTEVYADQAYNLGLIDWHQKEKVEELTEKCADLVHAEDWLKAALVCDGVLAYIVNVTGGVNSDDVRLFSDDSNSAPITAYLNRPEVRQAINVSQRQPFTVCNRTVQQFIRTDEMKSTKHLLPALLDNYQVLLYSGQFDLNVGPPGTEKYLRTLVWSGSEEFLSAQRQVWKVDGKVAGYAKVAKTLTYINVNNAGHMVPATQPENALDMMDRFMSGTPFF